MGPKAGPVVLNETEIFFPTGNRTPDYPAHSQVTVTQNKNKISMNNESS
jgi:hypothetical protein